MVGKPNRASKSGTVNKPDPTGKPGLTSNSSLPSAAKTQLIGKGRTTVLARDGTSAARGNDRVPADPRRYLSEKFDAQTTQTALLSTIDAAIAGAVDKAGRPPVLTSPDPLAFWIRQMQRKREVIEALVCSGLTPQEHLRAIEWLGQVGQLDPDKGTFREDLFVLAYKKACIQDSRLSVSDAVFQAGLALRKFYQVTRQKTADVFAQGGANPSAIAEIQAYESLMTTIEDLPIAAMDPGTWPRLANTFRRIDPYLHELTSRHARFSQNVAAAAAELKSFCPPAAAREGP